MRAGVVWGKPFHVRYSPSPQESHVAAHEQVPYHLTGARQPQEIPGVEVAKDLG